MVVMKHWSDSAGTIFSQEVSSYILHPDEGGICLSQP